MSKELAKCGLFVAVLFFAVIGFLWAIQVPAAADLDIRTLQLDELVDKLQDEVRRSSAQILQLQLEVADAKEAITDLQLNARELNKSARLRATDVQQLQGHTIDLLQNFQVLDAKINDLEKK